jgi:type I restriction enzyme S subunit
MVSFATIAKPIFDRIGHNRQQAQTLANLRDTLLPRLISGQLLLSEVDSLR